MVIEPYFKHKASFPFEDEDGNDERKASCPFCACTLVFLAELQSEHACDTLWECVCERCYCTGPAARTREGALDRWSKRRVDPGFTDLGKLEAIFQEMSDVFDGAEKLFANHIGEWAKTYAGIDGDEEDVALTEDEQVASIMSQIGRIRSERFPAM